MAFDMSTARPVKQGFDITTAKPVQQEPVQTEQPAPELSFYEQLRNGLTNMGGQALNVAGEFAAGANRNVAGTLDFLGLGPINAALSLAGSEKRVPTLTGLLDPTGIQGGFMAPGMGRDVVRAAGGTLPAAGGMMQVPRNLATAGGVAAEYLGFGSAAPSPAVIAAQVPSAIDQKLSLLRQTGNTADAGVMLDAAGNVVKDKAAKATTKQGFDPGFIAMVKSTTADLIVLAWLL